MDKRRKVGRMFRRMIKIKSTIVPQEYIDKFPVNDLRFIESGQTKIIDHQNKVVYDSKKEKRYDKKEKQ